MITVRIDYDSDVRSPCEDDGTWKIYSFSGKHLSAFNLDNCRYSRKEEIFPDGKIPLWLHQKLKHGTAFFLDYYEHGNCIWRRASGGGCDWDTTRNAGIAIWEEPMSHMSAAKTPEDRGKDLDHELETYTDWCNGACYWYEVEYDDEFDEEDPDSCGGYIGEDGIVEAINEILASRCVDEEIHIIGEAAWVAKGKLKANLTREEWDAKMVPREIGAGI